MTLEVFAYMIFCLVSEPSVCKHVEIKPDTGRIKSMAHCAMGGMMVPTHEFTYAGERWRSKGVRCEGSLRTEEPLGDYLVRRQKERENGL